MSDDTLRQPPCAMISYDERKKKDVWYKPNVNCEFQCERCGWNPEVKKRRIDRMMSEIRAGKNIRKKGGQ